ncbi:MAG TPA: hypothetical protein V6D29_13240 [Leptolyngbyaceae cyanobacterium]
MVTACAIAIWLYFGSAFAERRRRQCQETGIGAIDIVYTIVGPAVLILVSILLLWERLAEPKEES